MQQTPAHNVVNNELLMLIPGDCRRIVEVGCMQGALARAVLERQSGVHYTGIDIDVDYAGTAAAHVHRSIAADIERMTGPQFDELFPSDCWIFGDCLEHLRDPWKLLAAIRARIDDDGCLLACMPNAQHWSVQWRLASGNFRYEDSGLMDRTHIRWFTRVTMLEMFAKAGWAVEAGVSRNLPVAPQQDRILGALRGLAEAGGFDADQAVQDATPYQYVFKLAPA